jgi:hypothetical protein
LKDVVRQIGNHRVELYHASQIENCKTFYDMVKRGDALKAVNTAVASTAAAVAIIFALFRLAVAHLHELQAIPMASHGHDLGNVSRGLCLCPPVVQILQKPLQLANSSNRSVFRDAAKRARLDAQLFTIILGTLWMLAAGISAPSYTERSYR